MLTDFFSQRNRYTNLCAKRPASLSFNFKIKENKIVSLNYNSSQIHFFSIRSKQRSCSLRSLFAMRPIAWQCSLCSSAWLHPCSGMPVDQRDARLCRGGHMGIAAGEHRAHPGHSRVKHAAICIKHMFQASRVPV